jgi:hypothetical protein
MFGKPKQTSRPPAAPANMTQARIESLLKCQLVDLSALAEGAALAPQHPLRAGATLRLDAGFPGLGRSPRTEALVAGAESDILPDVPPAITRRSG